MSAACAQRFAGRHLLAAGLGLTCAAAMTWLGALAPQAFATQPAGATAPQWTAYVANFGSGANSVTPINLGTGQAGAAISAGTRPVAVAITPDGAIAYVTDLGANAVTPITIATDTPGSPITVGTNPGGIAITPNGSDVYVANAGSGTVTPIHVASGTTGPAIIVGSQPHAVALTPDGTKAYVTNSGSNTVTPIALATGKPGPAIAVGAQPQGIAITPDGTTAYVANAGSNSVTPIDVATDTPGTPIAVGASPYGVAITPDGTRVYVANSGAASVTPITVATSAAGPAIVVGTVPRDVAISPDGATAYVTKSSSNTVTQIAVATNTAGAPVATAAGPLGIAITPDQAPVASFTASSAAVGEPVSFDASASTVRYGEITSYHWDFGDGQTADTTVPTTSHTYSSAGDQTATVSETDGAGTSLASSSIFTGQLASRSGGPSALSGATVTITRAATATGLASSGSPSALGGSVTYTANVGPVAATGTVDFQDGGTLIAGCGAVPISAGVASCSAAAYSAPGTHPITAVYAGDANYAGSTSSPVIQTVSDRIVPVPTMTQAPAQAPTLAAVFAPPASTVATATSTAVVIDATSATATAAGVVPLQVSCPASAVGGCHGTVTLTLPIGRTHSSPAAGRVIAGAARCTRGCRPLGSGSCAVPSGATKTVNVALTKPAQKTLQRARTLAVVVNVSIASGTSFKTTSRRLALHAPAVRRSRAHGHR